MEDCYGRECELRQGDKCLHPDVVGDSTRDEPSYMMFCPRVKYSNDHVLNKVGR